MFRTIDGRYQVVDVDYENSGGGCMVLVTTVYDSVENQIRYVLYSDEGGCLTTVDYVFSGVDYEDKMLIASYNEEEHRAYFSGADQLEDGETNELFEYCWFKHIVEYCKRFKTIAHCSTDKSPYALLKLLPAGYKEWLDAGNQLFEFDGEQIIVDSRFKRFEEGARDEARFIKELKQLKAHMDQEIEKMGRSDEETIEFYETRASISFGTQTVHLCNSAPVYQALYEAIDYIISEY